jgi:uroporphyrinogen-III synthase
MTFDITPALVVGEATARAVGQAMGVETVFRHIDADGIVLHLFRASACHSGLSPGYPVQAKGKDEGDLTLGRVDEFCDG